MSHTIDHIKALRGPILVTGASGFVGANLLLKLLKYRSDVFGLVQRQRNWRLNGVPEGNIVTADLNDESSIKSMLALVAPRSIFNCFAYGAYSFERDADLICETNFLGLVKLVEVLTAFDVAAFIHAGSSSEYGVNSSAPVEDAQCTPDSYYSLSKLAGTQYLTYMGRKKSFPCLTLRLYSVYGPLEDTSRLIPNMVRRALAGTWPPLVNPEISRDFVYIDDVCEAFILAALKMNPSLYGEVFNIGAGIRVTIGDLANEAATAFKVPSAPSFESMSARDWDRTDWFANPAKANSVLGWHATTAIQAGLIKTGEWIKDLSDEEFAETSKLVPANRKRSISAIIACYKDAQAIPVMHGRLTDTFKKLKIDYEIIFVNDGSPDLDGEAIRKISATDARVLGITHSRNFGSQMAFRSGMELATKDAVVLLDGDLQDPPELIEQFYAKWEQGHDVVYGRRIKRDMPLGWGLLYKAFYRVFAALSYVKVPLDAGDFSLIDRRVVQWILRCPERDLFMRGLRAYVGFKQTGIDYVRPERMFGQTTNSFAKNLGWAKKGIFSFSDVPITALTATGIVLLGISAVAALGVAAARILVPDIAPRGATTLLITVLAFGSLNLFAIGLVGEYVAKIMIEVKGRPRLIRSALIRNGAITDLTGISR